MFQAPPYIIILNFLLIVIQNPRAKVVEEPIEIKLIFISNKYLRIWLGHSNITRNLYFNIIAV